MTFRLKDQLLQEQLDEISLGGFSGALDDNEKAIKLAVAEGRKAFVNIGFDKAGDENLDNGDKRFRVCFAATEFEVAGEFKGDMWNCFDGVTPPRGVWLAVEFWEPDLKGRLRKRGVRARYAYSVEKASWCFVDDMGEPIHEDAQDIIFRLWEPWP